MYKVTKKKPWITVVEIPIADIEKIDVMMGKEPVELMEDAYKRLTKKPKFMLNGNMFNMKDGKTCTNLIDEHTRVAYGFSSFGLNVYDNGSFKFDVAVDNPKDFLGGCPSLIKNGKIVIDGDYGANFMGDNPRSAIGSNATSFFMVAIDGRQKVNNVQYEGMTMKELADFMLSLGCTNASNLDGGGSTRLLQDGKQINTPCEKRAVDNFLCIYLKEAPKVMSKIAIVLSPSQQIHNTCAAGDTEGVHMRKIFELVAAELKKDPQLDVFLIPTLTGTDAQYLTEAVKESNTFVAGRKPALHICGHSDAGATPNHPNSHGASAFWYADGGLGEKVGRAIWNRVCKLTPWTDMSAFARPELYELKNTDASAALIEISFHDDPTEAAWIHSQMPAIAQCFIDGMYEALGLTKPIPAVVTPPPVVTPTPVKLTYEQILDKISANPAEWKEAIKVAVAAAKADGNLGPLEIFQFLPDLIVKVFEAK